MKFVRIGPDDAALFDAQVKNEYAFVKFYSGGWLNWVQLECACAKNVGGFPTIMAVRPGGFVMREYFGPRDTKSFLNFIRKTFPRRTMNVGRKTKSRRKTKTKRKTERKANKVVERKKPVYKKRKVASTTKRNIRIKR